ncbi:MAG: amidohydrolase family protein [bacterium]
MKTNKKIIVPKQIITVNNKDEVLRDYAVEITENIITNIIPVADIKKEEDVEIIHYPNLTLIPGFVQTHIHLCQTLFRGLADDLELLDWLKNRIFLFENAHNYNSLKASSKLGIYELQTKGTTTLLDMGTLNHMEAVFDEMLFSGMRGLSGKCMIDENDLVPKFKETTQRSLDYSVELAKKYHNTQSDRIKYAFAPRFALSCSYGLMKDTMDLVNGLEGSLYHTHSSENKDEIKAVKQKYGAENVEFFNSIGVLNDKTVLAHCIHLNEKEIGLLKDTQTRVSHCPSSNLKLGSGIANIPRYLKEGIQVSIGADGAPCNNNLSIFTEMRLAALIQKPIFGSTVMDAKTTFKLATIEGAKALHLEKEIGSIEVGKKADLVFLNLEQPDQCLLDNDENLYSNIVYSASHDTVKHVMIDGNWVVFDGKSVVYDKDELFNSAKEELKSLLKRIDEN